MGKIIVSEKLSFVSYCKVCIKLTQLLPGTLCTKVFRYTGRPLKNAILHFNYYFFKIAEVTSKITLWLERMIS